MLNRVIKAEPVRIIPLVVHADERGDLISLENGAPLPFEPVRLFFIRNVPTGKSRARHAVSCDMFLVLQVGSCNLHTRISDGEQHIRMDDPNVGILVPAGTWLDLSGFSADAIVLVMCSKPFDAVTYHNDPQI